LPEWYGIFLNRRWHEYTGLSLEVARGWGWQEAIHAEDLKEITDKWLGFWPLAKRAKSREGCADSTECIDGSCFGLSHCATNRATLSTGMERIRTIDDLKRAEAKLRKDEEELRRMTERFRKPSSS